VSPAGYVDALDLCAGAVLVCAVIVLWRRDLGAIVRALSAQGIALGALAGVLAVHEHDAGLGVVAVLVLGVKGFVIPKLLRQLVSRDPGAREASPLLNVSASLVAAAVLIIIAFVASAEVVALLPNTATHLVPIGLASILLGFFGLVTRKKAVSQIVGLLLIDNGIALVAFLLTAGVPLIVELGASLDVLLVVVVLRVLAATMRQSLGPFDLDQLRELHD
jgi:hydrogenase-4 component E